MRPKTVTRPYDRVAAAARSCRYNKHRLHPWLVLPSRAAWALAFDAADRHMMVAELVTALVVSWASAWEEQLGPTDRKRFLESIPYSRGNNRAPTT